MLRANTTFKQDSLPCCTTKSSLETFKVLD